MSTQLDALLGRIPDANLRALIAAQIADLREQRAFGLIFEEHLPETVRLPRQKVRRGVSVAPRSPGRGGAAGVVGRVRDGVAVVRTKDDTEVSVPVDELVVIRDFGDAIYPGLVPIGRVGRGGDKPDHVVIEGENYHALETLLYTHPRKIDCVYLDPPYNTGGDLIYNDSYVGKEDAYRHSKWLSFMDRRLRLARSLLSDTGVIVVAIDDNEQAHLKVLMDQVFGESNFLLQAIWQGGAKNDVRFSGGGVDYMLVYAKSMQAMVEADIRWRAPKEGLADVLDAGEAAWRESGGDHELATRQLNRWWNRNKSRYEPGLGDNVKVDVDGTVIKVGDLSSTSQSTGFYDLIHPKTGQPVPRPARGWAFAPDEMARMVAEGRVLFGPDHTSGARKKTPLAEMATRSVVPSFYRDRRAATLELTKILGEKRFDFPKDVSVLRRWIDLVTSSKQDAVILDFFAGSGATAHAVMELNAADGGTRQCILVTNNEVSERVASQLRRKGISPGDAEWEAVGIFEHVTRPRLETVVTGKRSDGTVYSDGLDENVTFLTLDYLDRDEVQRGLQFRQVAPLFWLRAGAAGPIVDSADGAWIVPESGRYGVLFDVGEWRPFTDAIHAAEHITTAFVITDSRAAFAQVASALPTGITPVQLYEDYLTNFEINTGVKR